MTWSAMNYKGNYDYYNFPALDSLVAKLDKRLKKKESQGSNQKFGFLRYTRTKSSPYASDPPLNAPSWTYASAGGSS